MEAQNAEGREQSHQAENAVREGEELYATLIRTGKKSKRYPARQSHHKIFRRPASKLDCSVPFFCPYCSMLDLSQLFSPTSGCPAQPLPVKTLAIHGALPPSTAIHLALAFAANQTKGHDAEDGPHEESSPRKNVLILATSRLKHFEDLVWENDEYLCLHGGTPTNATLLENHIQIIFLDTMARWTFFCSAVGHPTVKEVRGSEKLQLRQQPDLVIVQGLSLYLDEKRNAG